MTIDSIKFLQIIQTQQLGVAFDQISFVDWSVPVNLDSNSDDIFWNSALITDPSQLDFLDNIEVFFKSHNRKPCLTFLDKSVDEEKLHELGYTKAFSDVWLFFDDNIPDKDCFKKLSFKQVESPDDLDQFLETLDKSYSADDPSNPYGSVTDYLPAVKKTFEINYLQKLSYYLVFQKAEPVAVGTLNSFGGVGYISNIGSLPHLREQGFGKAISLH